MQNSKLQSKIKNFYFLVVVFSFLFLLFNFSKTEGAQLNLISQTREIGIGQQFQVDLMLDTEEQVINAIEGEITFPKELLEIKEIRDGDSIINLWAERPSIKPAGKVIFSGIIPTGFAGVLSPYYEGYRPGRIFSLIFVSKNEGEGTVNLENGKVLLHDGLGTPAQLSILPLQVKISREISLAPTPSVIEDFDPPEEFKPEIARDPTLFDGKWFLVFNTQDKGAGVDHYEVKEKREFKILNFGFSMGEWIKAESPYLLKDQSLKSEIFVKAIDKTGNETVATLPSQSLPHWYENYLIWVIIIVVGFIGYIIWRFLWRKFHIKK